MRPVSVSLETTAGSVSVYDSQGQGPCVVLLHGNSLSASLFSEQLTGSFGDSLRVVAFDLPGHGRSQNARRPETDYSLPGYARILEEVADGLDLDPFVLVGVSLGGHIALEYSATADTRLKAVAAFGTPPVSREPEDLDRAFKRSEEIGYLFQEHLTDAEARQFLHAVTGASSGALFETLLSDVERSDGRARRNLASSLQRGEFVDEAALTHTSRVPLLMAVGERDAFVSQDYVAALRPSKLFGGRFRIVEGAHHSVVFDSRERFEGLLREFLGRIL